MKRAIVFIAITFLLASLHVASVQVRGGTFVIERSIDRVIEAGKRPEQHVW
jgi:hypothetical protein